MFVPQWNGEPGLRDTAEGKVVVARLVCRDASPKTTNPGVFSPCVTFRVAGSPSKTSKCFPLWFLHFFFFYKYNLCKT